MRPRMSLLLLLLPVAACQPSYVNRTFDGIYAGQAELTSPPVQNCEPTQPASEMTVKNGEVMLGLFRGWVAKDGTVQMQSQQNTLGGQFSGNSFNGTFNIGSVAAPGVYCTYKLVMTIQHPV